MSTLRQIPKPLESVAHLARLVSDAEGRQETGGAFPAELVREVAAVAGKAALKSGDITGTALVELVQGNVARLSPGEPFVGSNLVMDALTGLAQADFPQRVQTRRSA